MIHPGPRNHADLATRAAAPALVALLALALALVLVPGCATLGFQAEPVGTLVVENDDPMSVNIYATRNGARIRLGTVTSMSSREFDLRQDMLIGANQLRLVVEPIGSPRSYPATPIRVNPGDVIELRISTLLR